MFFAPILILSTVALYPRIPIIKILTNLFIEYNLPIATAILATPTYRLIDIPLSATEPNAILVPTRNKAIKIATETASSTTFLNTIRINTPSNAIS